MHLGTSLWLQHVALAEFMPVSVISIPISRFPHPVSFLLSDSYA
jgi:hypothetical protein